MTYLNPTSSSNYGWRSCLLRLKMRSLPGLRYLRRVSEESPIRRISGHRGVLVYGFRAVSVAWAPLSGFVQC